MKRILVPILILVGICVLLLFNGCRGISSQYILTNEYTNPNTNQVEQIDIPVSQYVYDQTKVGDSYDVTVKTLVMGRRVPVTKQTSGARLALADTLPIMLLITPIALLGWLIYQIYKKRTTLWCLIAPIGMLVVICLVVLPAGNVPEFSTTGIIVDKTFQIVGGGL